MTDARTHEPTRRIVTNAAAPQPQPGTHRPCGDVPSPAERPPVERPAWRIPTDPPPV